MSSYLEIIEKSHKHVWESSESELSNWLIIGFTTDEFSPINLFDEPAAGLQIQYLFATLDEKLQQKLRNALLLAISKWSPAANAPELFLELVQLAAYTKTPEVIDFVRKIMRDDVLESFEEDVRFSIMEICIAVVAGFAPLMEAKITLEELYTSPRTDPRFAGQLLLGLCSCKPENYYKYIPRFLNLIKRLPSGLRLDIIFAELVRIVSLRTIAESIAQVDVYHQPEFVRYLAQEDWSPARLSYRDDFGIVLIANPDYLALGPEYAIDNQVFPLFKNKSEIDTTVEKWYSIIFNQTHWEAGEIEHLRKTAFHQLLS